MKCCQVLLLLVFIAEAVVRACQTNEPGTTVTVYSVTVSGPEGSHSGATTGLTGDESDLIRLSWDQAKRNGNVAPRILFRFLEIHPEYQNKFAAFAHVPQWQLMENGDFHVQAYTIMDGLDRIIQLLDSPQMLAREMSDLGRFHFERGITSTMFIQLAEALLDVLVSETEVTSSTVHAWINGLAVLIAAATESLRSAQDVPDSQTGLSLKQVSDVQRTWTDIRHDRYSMVASTFLTLFGIKPNLKSKFQAFSDVPVKDLPSNRAFKAQVELVADRLDSMISVLDTPIRITGQIQYLAFSHIPEEVGGYEFQIFAIYFMDLVRIKGISEEEFKSWRRALFNASNRIAKMQKGVT